MSSILFKRLAAMLVAAAMFMTAAGQPARAGEAEKLSMRYDVLVDGLQVFKLRYKVTMTPGRYTATAELDPTGFAGLFVKTRMDMVSAGTLRATGVAPGTFELVQKTKRKKRFKVSWDDSGIATTERSQPLGRYKDKTLKKALRPHLPDPLAAMLGVSTAKGANPCNRTERVYNGAEIYDLGFTLAGRETFGPDDGGVYRGPTYKCRIVYRPVAGLSRKRHAARSADPAVFTVWFAPVASRRLDGQILVPVAASGTLKNKDFVAYANKATLAGQPLNAQSLAKR